MKKIVLGVAVALMAGVGGIFAFSGCKAPGPEACDVDAESKAYCLQECNEYSGKIPNPTPREQPFVDWCEAHGVSMK